MTPNYFVFCEGETEVAYVEMLRAYYRLPIRIIAKKTMQNITQKLVERCEAVYIQTKNDRTYLMYDLDVATMFDRLSKIKDATLLCSNPCFELWLLLHHSDQSAPLTSAECVNRLSSFVNQYKKGVLEPEEKQCLLINTPLATLRAKAMESFGNPSTTVYRLLEDLEKLRSRA
jgi:hypothetical protein